MSRDFRHDTEIEPNMRTYSPVSELVERLQSWDHCWPAPGLENAVAEAASTLTTLSTHNAELEREVKRLREAGERLKSIVEGIEGAMVHGTWRDEKGTRLKDTAEWVSLYLTLSTAPQGGDHGE